MGPFDLSSVEDIIMMADDKKNHGKPVDKKQLIKCLSWLLKNPKNKQLLIKKIEALLNSKASAEQFDATSISTNFNIFHSYQVPGRSGVVTKSGGASALISGEAQIFNRTMIVHRSMRKNIDVDNPGCTSLFISPSTSKSGFFALNLDRGLDSHQRPSNYERIYFEVPLDSDFEHLKEIVQTLFKHYCPTPPLTEEATTQKLWLEAIENGGTYSYNDLNDYYSNLSSALQHFATLSPHWVERSMILEYNPENKPTNPLAETPMFPSSKLSELVNFQKRFTNLSSYKLKDAKSILAKMEWFKSCSDGQDNSTLVADYKHNQVDEILAKYIASSSRDYDTKKVITFYHKEALERRFSHQTLMELDEMHSLCIKSDNWWIHTKEALHNTLANMRSESCGRDAFIHFTDIIPLHSNQDISQISALKCWDKMAQSMISERHATINWSQNQKTMMTEFTDLRSKIASRKSASDDLMKNASELSIHLKERDKFTRQMEKLAKRKEIISRSIKQLQAAMEDLKQPMQNERKLRKLDIGIVIAKIYTKYKPRKLKIRKNRLESFRQGTQVRLKLMKAMLEEYDKLSVNLTKINSDTEVIRGRRALLDPKYNSKPFLECKNLFRSQIQANGQINAEIKKMEQQKSSIKSALDKHQRLKPRD